VQEGSHPQLGGDFLGKHLEHNAVVEACYHHHDPFDPEHLLTAVTTACDAISASRPGARRESIDSYVEKVESLERIAREPKSARAVAVMQAGREVQINVDPEAVGDGDLQSIGDAVAARIEETLVYPGEIRVNVVRETLVRVMTR
jgi:ribonucrease Y